MPFSQQKLRRNHNFSLHMSQNKLANSFVMMMLRKIIIHNNPISNQSFRKRRWVCSQKSGVLIKSKSCVHLSFWIEMKFGCCAGVKIIAARGGINQVFSLVAARGKQRGEPIFACAFDESAECAPCTPPFLATPFQPYRGALHPNSHCIFYIFLINKPHPPFLALFLSRSLARSPAPLCNSG